MQIVVNSHVFIFDQPPTGRIIRESLGKAEQIPFDQIILTIDGFDLDDDVLVHNGDSCVVRATITNGLQGGKGGFGAMLRSLAKQKGKTKTTDFGACRDLSGRRLRHINDEIILNKWKEAKDRGEQFDAEEETATGIDLWYLSAPSWAEGVKVDKRRKFMKPRIKTTLCIDWMRARETKAAPVGAPLHWGCPRGARCEFAHGEDDLQGEARAALAEEKARVKTETINKKRDDYLEGVSRVAKDDDEIGELVRAGLLMARKKAKTVVESQTSPVTTVASKANSVEPVTSTVDTTSTSDSGSLLRSRVVGDVDINDSQFIVTGASNFGTMLAPHCHIKDGSWYYEVELQSDGLMQIGWTRSDFIVTEDGDGVGDCARSWGFDGYRQKVWHCGEQTECGPQTGQIWRVGDVVGCYLCLDRTAFVGRMYFSVNGEVYGPTFEISLGGDGDKSDSDELYFCPALSLESGERVAVNLGQETFAYYRDLSQTPAATAATTTGKGKKGGSAKKGIRPVAMHCQSVWLSIQRDILVANGFDTTETERTDIVKALDSSNSNIIQPDNINNSDSVCISSPMAAALSTVSTPPVSDVVIYNDVDLSAAKFDDIHMLESLGLGQLKHELDKRGLKSGGTVHERAQRLQAFRQLRPGETIDKKFLAKPTIL